LRHPYLQSKITLFANYQTVEVLRHQKPLKTGKNCVGWHYFKYQDNDPTAKGVDPSNIDANKGIVNNNYEVWSPMMKLMKELNENVYSLIEYFDKR